jgi:hypothetical protein
MTTYDSHAGPVSYPDDLAAAWHDSATAPLALASGGWSMWLRGDEIAEIAYNGELILRAIRVVVRDQGWGTVPPTLGRVRIERDGEALEVRFEARHREHDVHFEWRGILRLTPDELSFAFTGEALTGFLRNRIGIIVLHPPGIAGQTIIVREPSGRIAPVKFPLAISPHQPAKNIAGLSWDAGRIAAELAFEGDVFETEDQRNWTDASFKTYSTPLDLPFPVAIPVGTKIQQSVTLRCGAPAGGPSVGQAARVAHAAQPVSAEPGAPIRLGERPERIMPEITVGASTAPGETPDRSGWPMPSGILVELNTAENNWRDALARSRRDADGASLDVRIVASSPQEVDLVLTALEGVAVRRAGVFHAGTTVSEPELWLALESGVKARGLDAELVGGTRAYFTELNRNHDRLPASIASLAFSVTPQMHSVEREQVIESIAIQRTVAENAARIAAGRPLHIGPVTLRARFNAVATTPQAVDEADTVRAGYGAEHVRGSTDPRQESRALAAWLVASVDALTVPGVRSLSYFEAWGPRGIGRADGSASYPVALALGWVDGLRGEGLVDVVGTLPRNVSVLASRSRDGAITVLVSNLDDRPHSLRFALDGLPRTGWLDRLGPDTDAAPDAVPGPSNSTDILRETGPSHPFPPESNKISVEFGVLTVTVAVAEAVRWRTADRAS